MNRRDVENFNQIQKARWHRSYWFNNHPETFIERLDNEVERFVRKAERKEKTPAVRLNGTSDQWWEEIARYLFDKYSEVQFYDYTAHWDRGFFTGDPDWPANYHLTYSRKEDTSARAVGMLRRGFSVSVVHETPFPLKWGGFKFINGDLHDLIFLHDDPVVIGLKPKGLAKKDTTGFVIRNKRRRNVILRSR